MSEPRPVMEQPVCLLKNMCGSIEVCRDAIEVLKGINEPVVVVSVVGLYRTGKSYLMNLLAGKQTGFALGNTIESKTKGIWMWCVPHPSVAGQTLVLLHTEGLGDVDKGDSKNDNWIFCLAVLLSSTLVYNSRGTIDNVALEQLHYVTELSEQIKIKSAGAGKEDEDSQFVCYFPSFVWVVRDFTLSLEIEGKKVTADEYLDFALQLKKGVNKKVNEYNLPRECIRSYFPTRKCFVFPSPTSPENMGLLESLQQQDLVPAFLETKERFCEYIFVKSALKTLKGGHRVTGKLLGQLVQIYVDTIRSGGVPCLDNVVVTLANLENVTAVQEALPVYKRGMEEVKDKFPVSVTDFTAQHQKFSKLATSQFMKRSFKDDKGEYSTHLAEAIDMYCVDLLTKNEMASEEKCKDLLKNLFSDMNERLQNGEYSQCGGYEIYCRDRDAIVAKYRREPNKGVRAEAVLNNILKEREAEGKSILHADKKLTENDRNIQEEKEKASLIELRCKEEEERRIESERMRQVEQERQEDRIKQMEEKFNKEKKQQQEEMDKAIESKLKEQEALLEKGFREKAEIMEEQITSLQQQQLEQKERMFKECVLPFVRILADDVFPAYFKYKCMQAKLNPIPDK